MQQTTPVQRPTPEELNQYLETLFLLKQVSKEGRGSWQIHRTQDVNPVLKKGYLNSKHKKWVSKDGLTKY